MWFKIEKLVVINAFILREFILPMKENIRILCHLYLRIIKTLEKYEQKDLIYKILQSIYVIIVRIKYYCDNNDNIEE